MNRVWQGRAGLGLAVALAACVFTADAAEAQESRDLYRIGAVRVDEAPTLDGYLTGLTEYRDRRLILKLTHLLTPLGA